MPKLKVYQVLIGLVVMLSLFLSACGQAAAPVSTAVEPAATGPVTLKLALLPVMDGLPVYVAQERGLFASHGVTVEIIPVSSAPERDQLIASGQADGMINEVVSTIFRNQDAIEVQVVRYARTATADTPLFRILASADSGITGPEGLKGVEIGVSQGTVIEYLTDRLLQAEGFTADEIRGAAVPTIPERLALLQSGGLQAAMLPEPAASLAVLQGATVALDDTSHPEYSHSVYTFRKAVIDASPDAVRGFLAAIEEAVVLINADPASWRPLMVEKQLLPPPLAETFEVPQFPTASVPTQAQWDDALAWTREKGLAQKDVAYTDTVTAEFLPR